MDASFWQKAIRHLTTEKDDPVIVAHCVSNYFDYKSCVECPCFEKNECNLPEKERTAHKAQYTRLKRIEATVACYNGKRVTHEELNHNETYYRSVYEDGTVGAWRELPKCEPKCEGRDLGRIMILGNCGLSA
jgi:hypothetical protein